VTVCAACGADNREAARFCDTCGATLHEAPVTREQRKTVTVLFCDVTGSTALGESTDPEALRALLARYFERMKAIVESHGGTVEKFIGDAVMAVFGVPVAHEDDALAARASCGRICRLLRAFWHEQFPLLDPNDPVRLDVLPDFGDVLQELGDFTGAAAVLAEGSAAAQASENGHLAARVSLSESSCAAKRTRVSPRRGVSPRASRQRPCSKQWAIKQGPREHSRLRGGCGTSSATSLEQSRSLSGL